MRGRPAMTAVAAESVLLMSQVCEFCLRDIVDTVGSAQSDSPIW
jgi:hypothetical protein